MWLPSILASSTESDLARFIVACVSICQLNIHLASNLGSFEPKKWGYIDEPSIKCSYISIIDKI